MHACTHGEPKKSQFEGHSAFFKISFRDEVIFKEKF